MQIGDFTINRDPWQANRLTEAAKAEFRVCRIGLWSLKVFVQFLCCVSSGAMFEQHQNIHDFIVQTRIEFVGGL